MRRFYNSILASVAAALLLCVGPAQTATAQSYDASVATAFGGQCEKMLIREIRRARSEINIAIFTITRTAICKALVEAAGGGVAVKVKFFSETHQSEGMRLAVERLRKGGVECIPVKMKGDALMHHKFTVIDARRVLTGSFNYTTQATEANYENMVLIESEKVARQFLAEFERIKKR